MNRINQLFNSNKKDILSIYFVQVILPLMEQSMSSVLSKTWRQHD